MTGCSAAVSGHILRGCGRKFYRRLFHQAVSDDHAAQ